MSISPALVATDYDELSCPNTPVATHIPQITTVEAPELLSTVDRPEEPSLASTLKLPDTETQYLSSAPTPKPVFCLADVLDDGGIAGLETALGLDSGSIDVTVPVDGGFIETSSGPVARELKRRYDQLLGVGLSVRSPYVITGFVNQHGRSMYRIGHRDEHSAPAASAAEVEERITLSKASKDHTHSPPRPKRRSRLSMHFPQAMFAKPAPPPSRPPTATSTTSSNKKLRKTRSIPDMFGAGPIVTNEPTYLVTGRAHSQSVTAADLPRPSTTFNPPPPDRQIDFFGDMMEWFTPAPSASSNFSSHSLFKPGKVSSDPSRPRAAVAQPFGNGVNFNVPVHKAPLDLLPTPRHLRVMQSFDSSRTARQAAVFDNSSDVDVPADESNAEEDIGQPTSAIRLSMLSTTDSDLEDLDLETQTADEDIADSTAAHLNVTPSVDSLRLSSHYSTEVFNVLQTYRGLPLFENLVPESGEGATVIKLSLAADQSATPRDDPRFVIWGETVSDRDAEELRSTSRDSLTDHSPTYASSSGTSRRRSSKISRLRSDTATSTLVEVTPQRVLLAATIERWIAQLTSDLNYDELLNFFLTYRTYVSGVDLCHLLICRFHWALEMPSSTQDGTVRRIVRVRTFVAIRYWLLTFFTVDFIPNRELRLLIADWLNTLIENPILKRHSDATDIVRRLIKVAKDCKRAHIRTDDRPKSNDAPLRPADHSVEQLLGKSFAEATRKAPSGDDVSELDLDFLPDEAKTEDHTSGFPSDPANAHLSAGNALGGVLTGKRPASLPLSSLSILQRTEHAPGPANEEGHYLQSGTVQLGMKHSALSRAFVRTIGRLGRWKRVLNPRSASRPTSMVACGVGVSAFDLDVSGSHDLLTRTGGVERYLKMTETTRPPAVVVGTPSSYALHNIPPIPPMPTTPPPVPTTTGSYTIPQSPLPSIRFQEIITTPEVQEAMIATETKLSKEPIEPPTIEEAQESAPSVTAEGENYETADESAGESQPRSEESDYLEAGNDHLREPSRAYSFRSSTSTDSFGAPLTSDGPFARTFPGQHNQWQFDVVSIDDLDMSDASSLNQGDPEHPPGLTRKPLRKLPTRRDFEFVRRSEVSSMGIVSHESMRDSFQSSEHSEASPTSSGPKPIHKWQMKSLQRTFESMSNDEDDTGDVEAALRRLEGHINPKTQQEKAEKVDGWVRTLQERMANGDYDYESSIFSEDEVEGFFDEVGSEVSEATTDNQFTGEVPEDADTPVPTQTTHQVPARVGDAKPAIEDVVPLEIIQSRMAPSEEVGAVAPFSSDGLLLASKFAGVDAPKYHQSFILTDGSTDQFVHCFAMIDRELFMGVKFEELVSEDWVECEEINVLDWVQYLKDRARWKVEGRFAVKTTALAALRARFNLMISFVISEIVLSAPSSRVPLISKFIRIAWKSYTISNFHTMTAIVTALQNVWVTRAMRKPGWGRVGSMEMRMYKDLKGLINKADDFKLMRQIVDSIVDSKPLASNHAASVVSGGDSQNGKGKTNAEAIPSACIPFIGIYLAQLYRHNKLPALIDPTAPHSVIGIDAETANFDPPAHPEVFSHLAPLPAAMHLEPLINVHKQRRIAEVIKALVAGQHLASRVQFEVDKRLFQRCLRLRGLDAPMLQRALAMYQD